MPPKSSKSKKASSSPTNGLKEIVHKNRSRKGTGSIKETHYLHINQILRSLPKAYHKMSSNVSGSVPRRGRPRKDASSTFLAPQRGSEGCRDMSIVDGSQSSSSAHSSGSDSENYTKAPPRNRSGAGSAPNHFQSQPLDSSRIGDRKEGTSGTGEHRGWIDPNETTEIMVDGKPTHLKQVIMYALDGCPYCDKARKLLTNFKIPFNDFVAKRDDMETKAKYKELTELETFPMIYIKNCDDPAKYAQIGGYTDLVRYIMTLQELQESDIDIVALKGLHDILSRPRNPAPPHP